MQRPFDIANQINALVTERLGLDMHRQTQDMLDDLLNTLIKESPLVYINQLRANRETDPIWQDLINALTIGETYFLRDRAHFHLLREHILPDLIARRADTQTLNIWSVGCATGEEPYSLAITLMEILPDYKSWTINLIGTDINERALRIARHGIYRKWAFRHTELDFQGRYFDPTADGLMIRPEIQHMVRFRQANLFGDAPPYTFDLILCRNVLLYFSQRAAHRAERVLYGALIEEGWLMLGHAESIRHSNADWMNHMFPGSPIYQKPSQRNDAGQQSGPGTYKRKTLTMEMVAVDPKQPITDVDEVQHLYDATVTALQAEDYDTAEMQVKDLLSRATEHGPGRVLWACILANRNEMDEAHDQLDAALYVDPLLADAHYLRAVLFIEQDDVERAKHALIASLYCQRNHPLASYVLGNLHLQADDTARAIRNWENTKRSIQTLTADSPVADISPLTAGQLIRLVDDQLSQYTKGKN